MTDNAHALDGKTVFVAGGAGLAGSSVVRALLAASPTVRVRAGCRGTTGRFIDDARVEYVPGDLRDAAHCRRLAKGCHWGVLCAANTGGAAQANAAPWHQVTDNLVMDATLLQALFDEGVRRAVYVGSASAYQECDGLIAEDDLDWNMDPAPAHFGVGWAKRAAEKLCRFWHDKAGIHMVIVRAANIYGPYAKFDPATANFIPALIRKAVERMDPFEIWGRPEIARDVLYADDFGTGVVALLTKTDITWDVFNLGSGRAVTVGDVVDLALRHANHSPAATTWRQDGPTTISTRTLDCRKITAATGWLPAVGLDEGIRRTVTWWQQEGRSWTR